MTYSEHELEFTFAKNHLLPHTHALSPPDLLNPIGATYDDAYVSFEVTCPVDIASSSRTYRLTWHKLQ